LSSESGNILASAYKAIVLSISKKTLRGASLFPAPRSAEAVQSSSCLFHAFWTSDAERFFSPLLGNDISATPRPLHGGEAIYCRLGAAGFLDDRGASVLIGAKIRLRFPGVVGEGPSVREGRDGELVVDVPRVYDFPTRLNYAVRQMPRVA